MIYDDSDDWQRLFLMTMNEDYDDKNCKEI